MTKDAAPPATAVPCTAREDRYCIGCVRPIPAGQVHLERTTLDPDVTRRVRSAECAGCATRYGRGALINPSRPHHQETAA